MCSLNRLTWQLLLLPLLFPFLFTVTPCLSFSFVYNGFKGLGSDNITLNGVADITHGGVLQLTNDTSRLIDHGFYPKPIRITNPATKTPISFSTSFVFAILPEYKRLGGHDLAFTITPTKGLVGAQPNQYLGLLNVTNNGNTSNNIYAVEFDTVQDLEFADINDNHVGINIDSMKSRNSTKDGFFDDTDSTKHDLNLKGRTKIQAWVDYDALKPELNVTISLHSEKPSTPILSVPVVPWFLGWESVNLRFKSRKQI